MRVDQTLESAFSPRELDRENQRVCLDLVYHQDGIPDPLVELTSVPAGMPAIQGVSAKTVILIAPLMLLIR